jgi:phosphoglycerol transferase MdoB-like AlkP superfamily enzyme
MKFISRRKRLKDNLVLGMKRYLTLNLAFLILLVIVRVYEYFYLEHMITMPQGSLKLELFGAGHDVLMLLNLAALFCIPFFALHLLSVRVTNFVFGTLIILFILTEIALIQFLGSTSLLLGADLFGYSFDEIIKIISAGGGFSVTAQFPVIIGIMLMVWLLMLSKQLKFKSYLSFIFIVFIFISLAFRKYSKPNAGKYSSELAYNLVTNKADHIFTAAYLFFYPAEATEASLFSYFYTGLITPGKSFKYISDEYPFLRKDDTSDVLGRYFNAGKEKPNLVFIIVESLGRAYSGEGAYLKSFTPFLDSLENHSLYWENVLSTAGRTFEVLPSVFGSMPYGKGGFAELGAGMPEGMSLISLLEERGYVSRFFYGGDATFDNMKLFLTKQHIDYVIDENDFGSEFKKLPSVRPGGFTWGYGEKDIFKKGFEVLSDVGSQPRLDIYLTLAMHDPYLISDQDYYNKKVEERLNTFKVSDTQKAEYQKYLLNYASMLYFNDALRYFFKTYEKRADYSNTIFFITGDHRMSSPPISTQIDRFHVPLIIYSPMLKSPAKFSSVVSHLDFTPSVVAFLKKNYGMGFPAVVPWLGQGLDSVKTFQNTMSVPFIRTKNEIIDYIDRDYFMVNNQLFKVSENMGIDQIIDENKLTEIQRKFDKFKADNLKACLNNALIPDSLKFKPRH